jgi:hypothetical protein
MSKYDFTYLYPQPKYVGARVDKAGLCFSSEFYRMMKSPKYLALAIDRKNKAIQVSIVDKENEAAKAVKNAGDAYATRLTSARLHKLISQGRYVFTEQLGDNNFILTFKQP